MPVLPVVGRLRQEDHSEFKASLSYLLKLYLKTPNKQTTSNSKITIQVFFLSGCFRLGYFKSLYKMSFSKNCDCVIIYSKAEGLTQLKSGW